VLDGGEGSSTFVLDGVLDNLILGAFLRGKYDENI